MKKVQLIMIGATLAVNSALSPLTVVSAAIPSPNPTSQAGQEIDSKLKDGTLACSQLTDDDYVSLGNFYMDRMMGGSADSMERLMERRLGNDGDRQMHIVMGKRISGCDVNAQFQGRGNAPMTWMTGGSMMGYGNNMMDGWGSYGAAAWIGMALFWLLVIGLIVMAVFVLVRYTGGKSSDPSALNTLKERYAKGEIGKEEFDQKRKDLKS